MRIITVLFVFLMSAFAYAQPTSQPNRSIYKDFFTQSDIPIAKVVPNLGIQERRPFWQLGLGFLSQPLPTDSVTLPRVNFGYVWVNESVVQTFELKVALLTDHHVADLGYGIGFGQRRGYWHVGPLVNLGYGHFYQNFHIHSLHYAFGFMANFGLPFWLPSLRFHLAGGSAGIAASNANFTDNRALRGGFFEIGVGLSIN